MKVKVAPTKLGNVLRALAAFVDENPGSEVHSLLADVWGAPAVKKAQRAKPGRKRSTVDVEAIVEQLRTAISREQGHSNIDAAGLTRIDLEAICRTQGLPVQRGDSVELLKDRIVEHLIGSRLRSEAIRNSTSDFKGEN